MELLSSDRCRSHSGHHHSHQLDQAYATSYRGHGQQQQQPAVPSAAKRLGRTPSSPSVFFSKVKERIREKVYETSTEWPHMAAIVQERRQRAADAFEARMSIRRQKTVHAGPVINDADGGEDHRVGGRRGRVKSDQQPQHHKASPCSSCGSGCSGSSFDRERAKSAFRRRSISEDTYNRQPPGGTQRPEDRGGVVCSNDELRAMAFEHKLRRSPVAVKHPETGSSSLECCRESNVSCDSLSNNSASSNPKLAMFRDGCQFPSTNSRDAPLPPVFPHSVSSTIQQHRDAGGGNASAGTGCRVSLTVTAAEDDDDRGTADARRQPADVACDGETRRRDSVVIREIVFDEHGQTWDIYGAEFDPEILGQAIQSHLEKIMRKNLVVDEARVIDASESMLRLRGDPANDCRPMCSNGERETTQRALGFFLRYLCSVARRK